jgi:hypothetical protein
MNRYRKWGSVIRYENGVFIHVEEAGEAFERDGVFQAQPAVSEPAQTRVSVPHSARAELESFVAQTLLSVQSGRIERFIASAGITTHEINGSAWTEESRRVHISLVNPPRRALIDLASFDIELVKTVAIALARLRDGKAPKRVRLAPNVSAALLPNLIGELSMEQVGNGFDGLGQPIETRAVTSHPPPNWYRPGYAVKPVRAWMNIRALPFGAIDTNAPIAIALLAPAEGTTLRVLCVDGDDVFSATLDASHIAAVSRGEPVWYPYAGGSFGAEMML